MNATSSKRIRQLEREFQRLDYALRALDVGKCDHLFADAATKAAVRADLDQQLKRLLEAVLRACPHLYEQISSGRWRVKVSNVVLH